VAEKTLSLDFKNPWKIVVEFNSTFTASTAAGGQNHETSNWRCLLNEVRTFFNQNPAGDNGS
jgi:hypothetical protein